MEEVIFTLEL